MPSPSRPAVDPHHIPPPEYTPFLAPSAEDQQNADPLEYHPQQVIDASANPPITTTTTTNDTSNGAPRTSNGNSNRSGGDNNTRQTSGARRIMDNIIEGPFRFRLPGIQLPSAALMRAGGVYFAGALFSLGFWFFIDASVFSKTNNASNVHIMFVDWIPIICSSLGMLVINSIDKARLTEEGFAYSDQNVTWKAKLVLFLGFALLAGGLAGSATVLAIKYIVPHYEFPTLYLGVANVVANALIMLSSVVLWVSQFTPDDYSYHLTL